MTQRTGVELIQDFLETCEVPYVFGNPGTTETTFLGAVAASKARYILSLHESSAVGIAAGHAMITGRPAIVNLHTYAGLANGMCNMRNAPLSGVPRLVINGQQDSRFLIHNPVLGAPWSPISGTTTPIDLQRQAGSVSNDDSQAHAGGCTAVASTELSGEVNGDGGAEIGASGQLRLVQLILREGFRAQRTPHAGHTPPHRSMTAVGDVNGDGYADLPIGAPTILGTGQRSESRILLGGRDVGAGDTVDVGSLTRRTGFAARGAEPDTAAGAASARPTTWPAATALPAPREAPRTPPAFPVDRAGAATGTVAAARAVAPASCIPPGRQAARMALGAPATTSCAAAPQGSAARRRRT